MSKPKVWKLEIPEIVPSANVLQRMHWAKMRRLKRAWFYLLLSGILELKNSGNGIQRAKQKRSLRITRYSRGQLDKLNSALGADKLIADNLISLGVIVDDAPRWCDISIGVKVAKKAKTVIRISEVK